jgi:hypothetical protein
MFLRNNLLGAAIPVARSSAPLSKSRPRRFEASSRFSSSRRVDAGRIDSQPRRQSMRVMVLVKATVESESGLLPSNELLEAMTKFNEELVNAGVMLAGEGLKPSSSGKRVAFRGADRTVYDGPFAETNELVAGFWLWEVRDMAEAVEWVKRCPNPMPGPSEIEIRPLYEAADFGDAMTPEITEAEDRIRKKLSDV